MAPHTIRKIEGNYAIAAHATVHKGIRCPAGIVIGQGAEVQGDVIAAGHVHIAKGAVVVGRVRAGRDAVVGARAVVAGDVDAAGSAYVLTRARVLGAVRARGDLVARPHSRAHHLKADGDVRVAGPVDVGGIEAGGRTMVVKV